jgi:Tfp pilus assembly protein PilO
MDYAEMIKKKNNYAIFLTVGTVLVSLLIIGIVIYPLYNTAASTTKDANQKSTELNDLKNKKKVLDSLKDKESDLKKSADLVSAALPQGKDIGGLFIQVDALAKQSGGKVTSVTGTGATTTTGSQATSTGFNGIQKYSYTVPVSFSDYASFKSFIQNSKTALRLLNIDDISISASEAGSIDAVFNITTYARN